MRMRGVTQIISRARLARAAVSSVDTVRDAQAGICRYQRVGQIFGQQSSSITSQAPAAVISTGIGLCNSAL